MDDKFYLVVRNLGHMEEREVLVEDFVMSNGDIATRWLERDGDLDTIMLIYTADRSLHEIAIDDSSKERARVSYMALEDEYPDCLAWCSIRIVKRVIIPNGEEIPSREEILEFGQDCIHIQLLSSDGRFWGWNLPFARYINEDTGYVGIAFDREPRIISHEMPGEDVIKASFNPWKNTGPGVF